jgi:hypothetical protein
LPSPPLSPSPSGRGGSVLKKGARPPSFLFLPLPLPGEGETGDRVNYFCFNEAEGYPSIAIIKIPNIYKGFLKSLNLPF